MKVVRAAQPGVEDLPPFTGPTFLDLESCILIGRIDHHVKIGVLLRAPRR